jgi:hypothetical protein
MATIKQKADKVREALSPFLELSDALQEIADLAADEQAVREATRNLGALKAEILRLGDEKVIVMSEISRLNEDRADAIAAADKDVADRISASNEAAKAIVADAELSASEILREAKGTANAMSQEVCGLSKRKSELEIDVADLSKKVETLRAAIAQIVAGV